MRDEVRNTLNSIGKRLENIETCLMKLLEALETLTSGKALNEELAEIKRDVLKLSEERNIFNKK